MNLRSHRSGAINLKWILGLSSQVLLLLAFASVGATPVPTPPKPDILLIMPDQFRGDCLSTNGHPVVRTPNLDALAGQGTLFRRAYSTCPSCIPARHSLLTGLFPATSGVVGYAGKPITSPTLPQLLDEAGYSTALVGRYMHQLPTDESYGYQKEVRGSVYVADDDYDNFMKRSTPDGAGIRQVMDSLGLSYNGWAAKPWALAEALHPTTWSVREDLKAIAASTASKPLFLTASFYAPHPPLFPPKKYYDYYYASRKLPEPAHGDWVDWKALTPKGDQPGHRVLLEGETLHATQAGYFGLIEQLDTELAPVIAAFKARSETAKRPWLILVTSDHGEMLGDHGYFRKCEPYEGAANIPFIIAASPELGFQPGLRSRQPVCLEDIMPTLLELAGAKCPHPMDGISLVPALRGKALDRTWLHSEHAPCYSKAQAFHALTDGRSKYIWRPDNGTEHLFDLEADPREEHDLIKSDAHQNLLGECRSRLIQELANRPEGFTDGRKLVAGRPYPPIQVKKLSGK